jgi:L-iditol 2-dehydrogenase
LAVYLDKKGRKHREPARDKQVSDAVPTPARRRGARYRPPLVLGLTKLAPGVGHVALSDRPLQPVGEGQVRVAVRAAGVCGTDLHIEAGEYPSLPPVTMGHEVCGVVEELSPGVDAGWLGARVVCETYYSTCGACRYCREGRINLCLQRRSIGTHVDGAFAPSVVLPARNLHRAPAGLPDAAAALTEPLACVCNSLFDPPVIASGDRVLVVGPGSIGLIAAQVARASGATVEVRGTARDRIRLGLAGELGLAATLAPDEDDFDVAVECSGSEGGIATCLTSVRRGGRVVQIGLRGGAVEVPFDEICFRELTVTSGNASTPTSWLRALELLEAGSVLLEPLVTEVVPLAEWERAFEGSRTAAGVKYVLDPA